MKTKFERSMFAAVVGTGILAGGCGATHLADRGQVADLRQSIPMQPESPRLVVVGPARLLHVEIQGRGVVSLYQVAARSGLDADCSAAPVTKPMKLLPDETNRLDLYVPPRQAVCMTGAKPAQRHLVEVHLHARRLLGPTADDRGALQARND